MFEFSSNAKLNKNVLIACHRPNEKFSRTAADFQVCPKCLGMYSKKGDHIQKCCKDAFKGERLASAMSSAVESRIHQNASNRLQFVCRPLRNTVGVQILKFDWLIIAFGNKMCRKYPLEKHEKFIRQMLRMCGRLFRELKSISKGITDFASLFNPRRYEDLLQAVRNIGKFDAKSNEFETPSTALDAMLQVKHVGETLVSRCIQMENHFLQKRTENFLKLLDVDASAEIYKSIYDSLAKKKRLKVDILPTTKDIKAMSDYLDLEIEKFSQKLSKKFLYDDWRTLSELVLSWIIVFNRKRTGESERVLITEFNAREYVNRKTSSGMCAKDKFIAERYARMRVCGKRIRTVSILLTPEIIKSIELLLKNRGGESIPRK